MATKTLPPLTKRQLSVLEFIGNQIISTGVQPTYRDIARHFGFAAQNGVVCHVEALTRKGYIERMPGEGRALRINWGRIGLTAEERLVAYHQKRFSKALKLLCGEG